MVTKQIETPAAPHLVIRKAAGNLRLQGGEDHQVTIQVDGEPDDLTLEQTVERIAISARKNCTITYPVNATLALEEAQANLTVRGISGALEIKRVTGNVLLQDVGPAHLEHVGGNLKVQRVSGKLNVATVTGNGQMRQVAQACVLGRIDGNLSTRRTQELTVQSVRGNAHIRLTDANTALHQVRGNLHTQRLNGDLTAQVTGNVILEADFPPGSTYEVEAEGNLAIQLPAQVSLYMVLQADGGIHSRIPDLILEDGRATLGTGEATLQAQAGGSIEVYTGGSVGAAPEGLADIDLGLDELENLGGMIQARVSEAVAEMETRLTDKMSKIKGPEIHRAAARVRREAERATQRARMRTERAQRRWQRVSGRRATSSSDPVSDEEKLRVLRMVETGKLTPDEAADLLAALGG